MFGSGRDLRNGNSVDRTCFAVGQAIKVDTENGALIDYTCTQKDVVNQQNKKFAVAKKRLEWALQRWSSMLAVKRTLDPITVDSGIAQKYGLKDAVVTDADLVIIMTMWPSGRPVAGYAGIVQSDQYHRPTVGAFNWVPESIYEAEEFNVRNPSRDYLLKLSTICCCCSQRLLRQSEK